MSAVASPTMRPRAPRGAPRIRTVVVTGASAGIGRATARAFGRLGINVGLLARSAEGLAAARAEIEQAGGRALAVPTDVADAGQVEAAAERVERELGPIDAWVNDAIATVFAPVKWIDANEYKRATEVTYLGTVYGTMAALRRMLPRGRGSIVQVGSALAYRSIPLQSVYCGAKHAIRGFTDSLRCELLHERSPVHVTMVQLSAVNTPQFDWARNKMDRRPRPLAPVYQPEVAAEAIVWAAHHRRRELWVGAPAYKTILGNKFVPALGDHVLASEGYSGQLSTAPAEQGRPDNLFTPLGEGYSARGRFGPEARERSVQLWLSTHRGQVAAAVAAVAGLCLAASGVLSARRR